MWEPRVRFSEITKAGPSIDLGDAEHGVVPPGGEEPAFADPAGAADFLVLSPGPAPEVPRSAVWHGRVTSVTLRAGAAPREVSLRRLA